ncbi:MAG TPA: hypothetical protein VF885_09175 [Arthrobacter sp.]
MEIIGITGFAQSGKDTAGLHLTGQRGFTRYAFADKIRDIMTTLDYRLNGTVSVAMLLDSLDGDWDKALKHRVYGPELQRAVTLFNKTVAVDAFGDHWRALSDIREDLYTLDPFLDGDLTMSELLGRLSWDWDAAKTHRLYGFEVRRLLQKLGTEVVRESYGANAWVDVVARQIAEEKPERVVLTDVRFDNEAEWLGEQGGLVVQITRPGVGPVNNHKSDAGISEHLVSVTVDNDSTLEALASRMDAVRKTPAVALLAA